MKCHAKFEPGNSTPNTKSLNTSFYLINESFSLNLLKMHLSMEILGVLY